MYLLSVILLSIAFQLIAGDCDAYNLPESSTTNRCHRVQECVDKAFFNNKNNQYIHEKVFLSTNSRPPIALVVKYTVTMAPNGIIADDDKNPGSGGSGSDGSADGINFDFGSSETKNNTTRDNNVKVSGEVSYVEELGWSTTGVYKAIRPVIFVALKPALYWWTLSFSIDNGGFPRSIQFDINITNMSECDFLEHITRSEVKEALEHRTMKLNYKTTGKLAYIWNTDTTSLQSEDKVLFASIVSLAIFILLLLTAILPKLYYYKKATFDNWNNSALAILLAVISVIEIRFHLLFFVKEIKIQLYSLIRYYLGWAMLSIVIIGGIYGAITSCCFRKHSIGLVSAVDTFVSVYLCGACFAFYFFPIVIETAVYTTEIISSSGFILIGVISMVTAHKVLQRFISGGSEKSKKTNCYRLQMFLVVFGVYFFVPIIVYISLILYLWLLRLFIESPTSQLTQTLLAFLPPILVGLGSYAIRKKLGSEKNHEKSEPPPKEKRNVSDQRQERGKQIRERVRSGTGRQYALRLNSLQGDNRTTQSDSGIQLDDTNQSNDRKPRSVKPNIRQQEGSQESESHELHVPIEVHPTNTSDVVEESTT